MLLNDIGKSTNTTFRKINQHLETNYGFTIAENSRDEDLVAIMEQVEAEITDLKIQGGDSKASPEISKRLLVLEGIRTLREFQIMQFQSPDLERVITGMVDFVVEHFRLGGMHDADFNEAVKDAMKHYRSSKYRFPDNEVEQRVRQGAHRRIEDMSKDMHGAASQELTDNVFGETIFEETDSDVDEETSEETGIDGLEEDFDLQHSDDNKALQKLIMDPNPTPGKKAEIAMRVYAKNKLAGEQGGDKPDRVVPMARQNGKIRATEGKEMRQHANLVKNLRRLLETEVSQAEVMMAAKGFASELQEMIEKIGRLQNEDLPPVTDQMRETYGTDSSSAFQTQIYGALQGVMDALYTAKSQVDDAVGNMATTGQVGAAVDMDKDIGMDAGMGDEMGGMDGMDAAAGGDLDNIAGDLDGAGMEDDMGGMDDEMGADPLGREAKMEAIKLRRKVLEMQKLVVKARKLREAKKAR